MAYGAVSYAPALPQGSIQQTATVSGTSLSSASYVAVTVPVMFRLVRVTSRKSAGTGTTGQPRLTRDTGGATVVYQASSAMTYTTGCDEVPSVPVPISAPTGVLYYWPMPNSAVADHTIADELLILGGLG